MQTKKMEQRKVTSGSEKSDASPVFSLPLWQLPPLPQEEEEVHETGWEGFELDRAALQKLNACELDLPTASVNTTAFTHQSLRRPNNHSKEAVPNLFWGDQGPF